jgi:hypothetical protein
MLAYLVAVAEEVILSRGPLLREPRRIENPTTDPKHLDHNVVERSPGAARERMNASICKGKVPQKDIAQQA